MKLVVPVIAAASMVFLLSACAPETPPITAPSTTVSASPEQPTPSALRPNPVFALSCSDIFSLDEVRGYTNSSVTTQRDETSIPGDLIGVADSQAGALSCHWGGDNRTDSSYDSGIMVTLIPDALRNAAYLTGRFVVDSPTVSGTSADELWASCYVNGGAGACTLSAFFDDSFVHVSFSDAEGSFASEADIRRVSLEVVEHVIQAVTNAGPNPQKWIATEDVRGSNELSASLGTELANALKSVDPVAVDDGFALHPLESRTEFELSTFDGARASVIAVTGAAWAAGQPQTEAPAEASAWQERRTADGVLWWFAEGSRSLARAAVGGSLVEIEISSGALDAAKTVSILTGLMESHAETPPGT